MSCIQKVVGLANVESSLYVGILTVAKQRIAYDQLEIDRLRRLKIMQEIIGKYDYF